MANQIKIFDDLIASVDKSNSNAQTVDNHQTLLDRGTQPMEDQLRNRLEELKANLESGNQTLAKIEKQKRDFQSAILQISGAIQVLQEELKNYHVV